MAAVTASTVSCRASPTAARPAARAAARALAVPTSVPAGGAACARFPGTSRPGGVSSTREARGSTGRAGARGGALRAIVDSSANAKETLKEEPALASDMEVDYTVLRDHLKAGEWELADNEHRRLIIVLAGEDAEDREWVYFTEVQNMPVTDMKTIDALWRYYSDDKFGFSVQRKIWIGQKRQWTKFFKVIDWTTGENGNYRKWPEEFIWKKDAARGHMPLTSALRGTQLLNALLEHPAYAPPKKPKTAADNVQAAASKFQESVKESLEGGMKGGFGGFKGFPGLKGLKKPSWMGGD